MLTPPADKAGILVLKVDHERRLTPVELGSHLLSDPRVPAPARGRVRRDARAAPPEGLLPGSWLSRKEEKTFSSHQPEY